MKEFAILWDYNGVIVNDEHLHEKAFATVVKPYGVDLSHDFFIEYCIGRSDRTAATNIKTMYADKLDSLSHEELLRQKISQYQQLATPETIIYPGAPDHIRKLSQEFRMALVSGSYSSEIIPTLKAANIKDVFEVFITAEDVQHGKPDPEGYLKALEMLDIEAKNAVVIEDTPPGITAAHEAKVKCIAVTQSLPKGYLSQADLIVGNVAEITPAIIKNLLAS